MPTSSFWNVFKRKTFWKKYAKILLDIGKIADVSFKIVGEKNKIFSKSKFIPFLKSKLILLYICFIIQGVAEVAPTLWYAIKYKLRHTKQSGLWQTKGNENSFTVLNCHDFMLNETVVRFFFYWKLYFSKSGQLKTGWARVIKQL